MQQGEVWLINLDPTIGSEIRKTRPAIIVNNDGIGVLPLRIIVPITDWKDRYQSVPWMVKLIPSEQNGLSKNSAADAFQVRSVSNQRFVKRLGKITARTLQEVAEALSELLPSA